MHWENSPKHHLHRTPRNKLRVSPPCFTSLSLIQPLTVPERKKKRKKKNTKHNYPGKVLLQNTPRLRRPGLHPLSEQTKSQQSIQASQA